tara:strand:+ start:2333 stop:4573 length:2241 start_codon:yes stop_codon:yes gene_type:complete
MKNFFKFITKLVLVYFIFFNLNAAVINEIKIVGNERVSAETIKVYGGIRLNENLDDKKLNEILNNLYSTDFFEDVKVNENNGILNIIVKEYPVVNQLIINGEPSSRIKEEIKKQIFTKAKRSFIKSAISNDINLLKKLYSSIGYNFANINIKTKELDASNVDVLIEIDRGQITKISSINFTGDKKIRDNRLRNVIASERDRFYKFISRNTKFSENLLNLDLRLLENYYKSLGYYDVVITSNSAELNENKNIDLIYSIEAGKRYRISKISSNVDQSFDKELFLPLNDEYKKVIGEYYSPFKVKNLLEEIDLLIEKNSLQFVEHNVEEIIEGDFIAIKFNIFEGEKILIERINITGNNVTSENVIRGELILDEGDPFTKLNLEKSISKIKSRNLFRDVKYEIASGSARNLKIININVEEKPTGEISAGAGIGTNGGSFAISISENNWLGEGKKVDFSLDVDAESLGGTLNFTNPNYNFLGNSLNYFVSSQTNDKPDQGYENTIISSGINTSFEQYKNIFTNLGVKATYDDLRTDSSASSSLSKQSGEFTEFAGSYGFKYDGRDRSFMPTKGGIFGFDQTIPFVADKNYISNTLTYSKYGAFSENIIGAGKIYLSTINGLDDDDVRLSKRKNLSTRRLRGFEKNKIGPVDGSDHIGGNYAAALNFEANLPNLLPENTKTDITAFLDFGNVWGVDYDSTIDESNEIRSSTGVAASWMSPLGPMTFVLSTNLSKANTDETESFNFNLGTTF